MHRTSSLLLALALPLSPAVLPGCADDDGAAPTISALTFSPTSAPVSQTTTVSGTFQFADKDGDLEQLEMTVTPPGGAAQTLPATPIQGVADMTVGAVNWAVQLTPPSAGDYVLSVTVLDTAEHASNALTATVVAP